MFKSAVGSKQLLLAKVVKVVNFSKVKVKFFDQTEDNSKIFYTLTSKSKIKILLIIWCIRLDFSLQRKILYQLDLSKL
jgi:hypothetical protein